MHVRIMTRNGWEQHRMAVVLPIDGLAIVEIAAHTEYLRGVYNITHLASGLRVASGSDPEAVRDYALAAQRQVPVDWCPPEDLLDIGACRRWQEVYKEGAP